MLKNAPYSVSRKIYENGSWIDWARSRKCQRRELASSRYEGEADARRDPDTASAARA